MPFPERNRFVYKKNVLELVVCQLRFPPILRIDSEVPATFQDRIRHQYPVLRDNPTLVVNQQLPIEIAKLLSVRIGGGSRAFEFSSKDETWQVALTREFLALMTHDYKDWTSFKEHLQVPLAALDDVYHPAFYSRIGLRYRDVIKRSALDLRDVPWSALLAPQIAAELASPELVGDIEQVATELLVAIPVRDAKVRMKHGLAVDTVTKEDSYVIDADFFKETPTEIHDAAAILDSLNEQAGRLFRWCITDRLHDAMGPRPVV